jgi:hypothetical protein
MDLIKTSGQSSKKLLLLPRQVKHWSSNLVTATSSLSALSPIAEASERLATNGRRLLGKFTHLADIPLDPSRWLFNAQPSPKERTTTDPSNLIFGVTSSSPRALINQHAECSSSASILGTNYLLKTQLYKAAHSGLMKPAAKLAV